MYTHILTAVRKNGSTSNNTISIFTSLCIPGNRLECFAGVGVCLMMEQEKKKASHYWLVCIICTVEDILYTGF